MSGCCCQGLLLHFLPRRTCACENYRRVCVAADHDTLYKRFEREYGFDGSHVICRQGSPVTEAMRGARSRGWSPVPLEPGLLKRSSKSTRALRSELASDDPTASVRDGGGVGAADVDSGAQQQSLRGF